MVNPQLSQDDLMDVRDISTAIETILCVIFEENDFNIAFSALMTANINFLLSQVNTVNEAKNYRNIFVIMFDNAINAIQIKGPDGLSFPPSSY